MAEYVGAALYAQFDGTDIYSGKFREWKDSTEMGLVDASAAADTHKTYLKTLIDGTATIKCLAQSGTDTAYNALAEGNEGSLVWGPEGNGSGKVKYTVNAIAKKRDRTIPYAGAVEYSGDFQFSDANGVVESTF